MQASSTPIDDDTVTRLRSGAHEFIDKVADATTHASDAIGQKGEQIRHKEQQYEANCRNYLHAHPVTTVGIAVGVGFLLSRILSGR
ncbi:MAG: DUF883 family protein [Methylococcaceae bacterium]|nr:DUF883 family protein [Methylococcaceae bacterium]